VKPETSEPDWQLFAAWVTGDTESARTLLQTASPLGPAGVREMLLMLHLFAGVPRMLEAAGMVASARRDVLPPPPVEVRREADRPGRGWEVFEAVYGDKAEAVFGRIRALHGDVAHWILGHAYGRVLGREGLSILDRELLAIAGLVALGTEPQLESHVRGALRCGADEALVRRVVDCLKGRVDDARWEAAEALFARRVASGAD